MLTFAKQALLSLFFALAFVGCSPPGPERCDAGACEQIQDAGADAGFNFQDAGADAGTDAGSIPGVDAGLAPATVIVHYDVGLGRRITLRGSDAPLNWTTGVDATWTPGNEWVASLEIAGEVELKPLIDDVKWANGPNWRVAPGQTVHVWPYFDHTTGQVTKWIDWSSTTLGNTRPIWVYTPPSYDENPAQRYPVVYMHDGQNLFYDSTAFGGVSWNVQGAMDLGIADGTIREALIVGIGNTSARLAEYTPIEDPGYPGTGKGDVYLQAVVDDLKPQVDSTYRTQPDAKDTAIAGSSLGGLISAHAGNEHPETFGLIGAFSPSTWWNGTWIIGQVAATKNATVKAQLIYVDSGDSGNSQDDMANTAVLAQTYKDAGYTTKYVLQMGANHSETYWRQRVGPAMSYLLGPGR